MKRMSMPAVVVLLAFVALAGCAGQPPAPTPTVREVVGETTVTTVLADFEGGKSAIVLKPLVSVWGKRIKGARADLEFAANASPEGGYAAKFVYAAKYDEPFTPDKRWEDYGIYYNARFELGRPPEGAEGVSLRLKPEGFTLLELYLVQAGPANPRTYYLPLTLADGAWRSLKIPFSAFTPTESAPPFDPARPVALEANVVFEDNWEAFNFRRGNDASAALFADDVGFWRSKQPADPLLLESFDDERDLLPFSVVLYGSSLWVDYTKSDEGEPKLNDGVRAQRLVLERRLGGAEGGCLTLEGRLEISPEIKKFHDAWQALTLFFKAPVGRPMAGPEFVALTKARAISFSVRSDIVRSGHLEVQDEPNDRFYGASFEFVEGWTRVRIPFERLETEGGTLATAAAVSDRPRLQIAFELPPEAVERAAAKGVLEFVIQLDGFRLER